MYRRKFVLGLTGTVFALPYLPDTGRLGINDVNRVRLAAAKLHQLDNQRGGDQLSDIAGHYIEHVENSARRCTYGSRVQTGLYGALGEVATSAGWFAFDTSQWDKARRWWDVGLRYALLAHDQMLQARIWSSMSHQAAELGHGGEAVAIARTALDRTRGRRDGKLSSLLHTRVARGHAVQGERTLCGRSLQRAEQAFDTDTAPSQPWLRFFNFGEVTSAASLCFLDLHEHPKAVEAARNALTAVQSAPLKRNAFAAHVRLGRCLVDAGEVDEAINIATRALNFLPIVRSPRIEIRLRHLRDKLLDRSPDQAADFCDLYQAVATCP